MTTVSVTYVETLIKTIAINVPDSVSDEDKILKAIEIGKHQYFDEQIILNSDDLESREIRGEYNQETTKYARF